MHLVSASNIAQLLRLCFGLSAIFLSGGRVGNLCSVNKNGVAGARIHGVVNEMRLSLSCYTSDT